MKTGEKLVERLQGQEDNIPFSTIIEEAESLISQFETKDPKSGWNQQKERWFPYKSLEGGAATIGYGEKLFPHRYSESEVETLTTQGISDPFAKALRHRRIIEGLDKLETFVGKPLDSFMSGHQQAAAASYIYNVGIQPDWKFTENLRKAAETEDLSKRSTFIRAAEKEMDIITADGKVLKGLIRRRSAEQELFRRKQSSKRLAKPE